MRDNYFKALVDACRAGHLSEDGRKDFAAEAERARASEKRLAALLANAADSLELEGLSETASEIRAALSEVEG